MKLTRLGLGLVAIGMMTVGCGSDDNTCGDAACPDAGALGDGSGGSRDANPFTITSGKYKATAVQLSDDGCMINPMALVTMNADMNAWVPVEISGGTMKVGNPKGEPPAPSL